MDKIRALRYFKRVAELDSFTAVAQEFHVPASSISRRIRDLEASLGVTLLQRSTRQVEVTELGKLYYTLISKGMAQLDQADELISQQHDAPSGLIRISCMPSYGEQKLPPLLEQFSQRYPNIIFDLHYSDDIISLGKDPIDIAIRGGYAPDEHVIAKRLSSNQFILVATPQYIERLGQPLPLTAASIQTASTLQYRGPNGLIDWHYLNNKHSDKPQWETLTLSPSLISNNAKALATALLNHRGLALIPNWSLYDHLKTKTLIEVPTESPLTVAPNRDIGIFLLYERNKYQIPKIQLCVDFLVKQLTDI
ncbi:LysR family transcriptional regulator [uncultured Shewanella sp.]|uniref:LysR family transcriptional regulator n=1 Tax=uncultured Shewanella sp. TaxID=173975 RepID=UPI002633EC2B|nr:LysR family transcriptional regulator [uncultured Shewanella sp.]